MTSIPPTPHATENTDWSTFAVTQSDDIVAAPLRRLAALLDREITGNLLTVPPLGHWLYFLPEDRQSALGDDGHPQRGGLLPPIAAPRRMWAGGHIEFLADLPVGARAQRVSQVIGIQEKHGRSGTLTFVTLRHEISCGGTPAIIETQDLVYRGLSQATPPTPPADLRVALVSRSVTVDSRALFRFSALTNNAHRIHYDRDFATAVEGYPALVVHGPFQATLLVDHLLRDRPQANIATFSFRGARPLFENQPFELNIADEDDGISLWTRDMAGCACMTATITLR